MLLRVQIGRWQLCYLKVKYQCTLQLHKYEVQSISFRTEIFAILRSVVTTPAASDVIPKVAWDSVLKVCIVCDATLAFIKMCNVLSVIIKMADFREQGACIKFCFKLGKTATECYEMLKTAFGEQAMGRSQTFQWFSRFKAGRTSIDDEEHSGRPVSSSTPEMIDRVRQIIRQDLRRTVDEVSMLVGISHGTCHRILTEDLKMRSVASKFVPTLLSVDQNQQRLDVCLDLKENAANDPSFLSNVIRGGET